MKMNAKSKTIWWDFLMTIGVKFGFEDVTCEFRADPINCECGENIVENIIRIGVPK